MNEILENQYLDKEFYHDVKEVLEQARKRVYRNIQNEMVRAYWQIGKMIVEKQGGAERAKYGGGLIKELAVQMTKDFGKGFTEANLRYMRLFYFAFPNCHTVCDELSWSHYRLLISLDDEKSRNFYVKEAVDGNWSVRQLQRAINTFSYQRYLASKGNHDVFDDTIKKEEALNPNKGFAPITNDVTLIKDLFPNLKVDLFNMPHYNQCLWAAESYLRIQGETRLTFECIFLYIPIKKMYEYFLCITK